MQNIAIIKQGTGRYLFSLPENVTLKQGDRVKCDTRRGIADGIAFADSAWVDENVSQLIGKLTGAKFPLRPVVGKMEYQPFEKPQANPANKYEGMSNAQLDREMCAKKGACSATYGSHRKNDCPLLGTESCDITDANRAEVIKYLLAEDAEAVPKPQVKPEPIKLYCFKSCKNMLTAGQIYSVPADGKFVFDNGKISYYDWKTKIPSTWPDCICKLVKRPAKVGEWVLLDKDDCFCKNKKGDVVKIVGAPSHTTTFCFINDPTLEYSGGICVCFGSDYTYVLDGYKPTPEAEPESEDKPSKDKQEPIKLYCVKDYYSGSTLTGGKTYDFVDGRIKYDGGKNSSWHANAKELCEAINENTDTDLIFPLVKRPADVGESFLIVAKNGSHIPPVEIGSVFVAEEKGAHLGGKYVDTSNGNRFYDQHLEYLVLDGYKPTPKAEPETEYFSGKVVCVSSGDKYFTVGKMYEFVNGEIEDDEGDARPICADEQFKSVEEWNSEYGMPIARFIEFKGEAND